jgi:glycosyltransferase involved in cell wall biosynthesis
VSTRLLWFNLATDRDDPILGFTPRWIAAVAARVEHVDVITMRAGRTDLPANVRVYSLGKERGYGEVRRAARFYRILASLLARHRYAGCFSHMMPLFSAMGGPLLKAAGVPITTWYAHPSVTRTLRVAHRFSRRVVASVAPAYPHRHDKLVVIGQGIDTALFAPGEALPEQPPLVLCVGRLSQVKGHETLLRAVALVRASHPAPFRVAVVGQATDAAYAARLVELARELGLDDVVEFAPGVPMEQLPAWYRRCTVHVNLTPVGFGDKVAWEAMACGRPCVLANEGFAETLGRYAPDLLFRHGDAASLAGRLLHVLSLAPPEAAAMGGYLRAQVQRLHGLEALAGKIVDVTVDGATRAEGGR